MPRDERKDTIEELQELRRQAEALQSALAASQAEAVKVAEALGLQVKAEAEREEQRRAAAVRARQIQAEVLRIAIDAHPKKVTRATLRERYAGAVEIEDPEELAVAAHALSAGGYEKGAILWRSVDHPTRWKFMPQWVDDRRAEREARRRGPRTKRLKDEADPSPTDRGNDEGQAAGFYDVDAAHFGGRRR